MKKQRQSEYRSDLVAQAYMKIINNSIEDPKDRQFITSQKYKSTEGSGKFGSLATHQ